MLGGYKCGWWKLVRDNDKKNCKFSNEFKNSFFLFFFCKSGEMHQFFLSFPRTTQCSQVMKNPVLAVYKTLAEKTSIWCKMF